MIKGKLLLTLNMILYELTGGPLAMVPLRRAAAHMEVDFDHDRQRRPHSSTARKSALRKSLKFSSAAARP